MMRHHRHTNCVAGLWTALQLLLLASTCAAKPSFTFSNYTVVPGEPFNLTWTGANGAVDINVASGTEDAIKVVWWIAHNDTSTSFVWTPPDALPSGSYMFEVTDSSGSAYSGQFQYVSKTTTPTTTPNSPGSTPTSPNSTIATPALSSPPTPGSDTPPEPELTPGAKAGIAIGAAAAAILGMVACSVIFYRRGRAAGRREAATAAALGSGGGVAARGGLEGRGGGRAATGAEDKEMFHELETSANLPEMQGSGGAGAGLGGSSRGGGVATHMVSPR